jgi:hypothetical protein
MLTERHPLWRPRQDLGQLRFPIKEAAAPAIEAIKEQEVEGVEDQVPTAAAERLVEQRNVRDPELVRNPRSRRPGWRCAPAAWARSSAIGLKRRVSSLPVRVSSQTRPRWGDYPVPVVCTQPRPIGGSEIPPASCGRML